ncbi:penicillin-binding protein activator [Thermodesulfobacteriota bacterium]
MRYCSTPMIKAVFTLWVGMAFFLAGCQPKPIREIPRAEEVAQSLFAQAEKEYQAGQYQKAFLLYQEYLREIPKGEKSRLALHRMADIYIDKNRYEEALPLLKKIIREYPGHPDLPLVTYDTARVYYRLGDYQKSREISEKWLDRYPGYPIQGEVLFLLGKNLGALGDRPGAFHRWVQAFKADWGISDAAAMKKDTEERVLGLIKASSLQELKAMEQYAAGSKFAPPLYHKIALTYLEEGEFQEAKAAAAALVQSTPEQYWVDLGREILERVKQALTVRPNVVGCLLPLSGPFSIYGQEVLNGLMLGMGSHEESQENGGLELLIGDTHGDPDQALSQLEEMAETGHVIGVIGPLASKPASAVAKRAQELGVPIITLTQKEGITQDGDMVFRNFLTPAKEIDSLANAATIGLGLKKFGILYPDNSYGRFFMNLFWDKVEELGGSITAVESYGRDVTDFASQIKKMVGLYYPRPGSLEQMLQELRYLRAEEHIENFDVEEDPEPIVDFDAVFIPDSHDVVAIITPQFPFHNVFDIRLLGTSIWQSPDLITSAGDYVQHAIFPTAFFAESESEPVKDFVENYRGNFESDPGVLAATGYDTMQFVKNLLTDGQILTRRDFQEGLWSYDSFYGVTGRLAFNLEGAAMKEPLLLTVTGRHFSPLHLPTLPHSLFPQPPSNPQF